MNKTGPEERTAGLPQIEDLLIASEVLRRHGPPRVAERVGGGIDAYLRGEGGLQECLSVKDSDRKQYPSTLTKTAPLTLRITDPPGAQRLTTNRW